MRIFEECLAAYRQMVGHRFRCSSNRILCVLPPKSWPPKLEACTKQNALTLVNRWNADLPKWHEELGFSEAWDRAGEESEPPWVWNWSTTIFTGWGTKSCPCAFAHRVAQRRQFIQMVRYSGIYIILNSYVLKTWCELYTQNVFRKMWTELGIQVIYSKIATWVGL